MAAPDDYYLGAYDAYLDDVAQDEPPPPDGDEPAAVRALRDADDVTDEERAADKFERDVEHQQRMLAVREEAARRHRAERTAEPPPLELLADFLGLDLGDPEFRIDDLLPAGGRVMLSAQYKAGKSTLVGNLIRALADGDVFLGEHQCRPSAGPIVLIDDELDRRMLQDWYTRQGIEREDRVALIALRGKLSSFDITDPQVLARWAETIAAVEPSVVILDCLRPVLDAIGLDEDKEAGRFLVAFDELMDRCGAGEAVVVHHMGHTGERSRGSSRLRDWPDVEWRLIRADVEDPSSARYFSAYGRDVDQPERELTFNPQLRRLTVYGGSRRDGELKVIGDEILDALNHHPGLSTAAIERELGPSGHTRANIRAALQRAINDRQVVTRPGKGRGISHHLPDTAPHS